MSWAMLKRAATLTSHSTYKKKTMSSLEIATLTAIGFISGFIIAANIYQRWSDQDLEKQHNRKTKENNE